MAEGLMNHLGRGRFNAYSAGSHPAGEVRTLALQTLSQRHLPTDGFRSKSWDEFAVPGAPEMDFVFTVCDKAAGKVYPLWPGQPMTAHWGLVLLRRAPGGASPFTDSTHPGSAGPGAMTTHVLILCTHNSARSVLSEGMLNHLAAKLGKDVRAHSAGSTPSGRINPFALEALQNAGVDTGGCRSKSWDEFSADGAPPLSIVITVCDSAAAETCPVFFGGNGQPVKVHWGYPDSSNAEGGNEGKRRAFELTRQAIGYRMLQLLALPLETMDHAALQVALTDIAKS